MHGKTLPGPELHNEIYLCFTGGCRVSCDGAILTASFLQTDRIAVMAWVPSIEEPSEAELVESFRATGDNRHFEALYRSARRKVFGVCLKFLRNADSAQDATHEAFVRAFERFPTLAGTNFSAWVSRIAANYCLNRIRQENTAARLQDAGDIPGQPGAERAAIAAEESDIARSVLRSLNPEQRQVLLLRYLEEFSHEEIETMTGFDAGQVRSYLQNGRRNFRIRWLQRTGRGGERDD